MSSAPMIRSAGLLLLALCLSLSVQAKPPVRPAIEQERIDYLITSIANLHDAVFIRNGVEYGATRAADHLRSKLSYAGKKVQTANDFIDQCATGSWLSHINYSIRFRDGHALESAVFLRDRLREFDANWARHLHR